MSMLDPAFFKPFIDGAIKTLATQCSLQSKAAKPYFKGDHAGLDTEIAGVIGLTSASFRGSIIIAFTEKVFLHMMNNMLGEKYTAITKDLEDGAAELLNIIFGQAKIVLNQQGHAIERAIPTVIRGKNLSINPTQVKKIIVIPFETEAGGFEIEICAEAVK